VAKAPGSSSAYHASDGVYDSATWLEAKRVPLDVSAAGNTTIVAAVASRKIRVLAYAVVCAGAVTVRFRDTDNILLTGIMSFAANGGIAGAYNPLGHFESSSGLALQITLGGAVQVGGWLVYVEVP